MKNIFFMLICLLLVIPFSSAFNDVQGCSIYGCPTKPLSSGTSGSVSTNINTTIFNIVNNTQFFNGQPSSYYLNISWIYNYNQSQSFHDWVTAFLYNYNQTIPAINYVNTNTNNFYNSTSLPNQLSINNPVINNTFNNTILFVDGMGRLSQSQYLRYQNSQLNITQVDGIVPLLVNGNTTINGNLTAQYYYGDGSRLTGITIGTYNLTYHTYAYNQTIPANAYTDSKLDATYFNATNIRNVTGVGQGLLSTILVKDNIFYNVTERTTNPAIDIRVNFTNIVQYNQVVLRYRNLATETHQAILALWNNQTKAWESIKTIGLSPDWNLMTLDITTPENYIDNNRTVQVRLYINSAGTTTHRHDIDWLALEQGPLTPSTTETDPYSFHTGNNLDNTGWNITADYLFGNINWSQILNIPSYVRDYDTDISQNLTLAKAYTDTNIVSNISTRVPFSGAPNNLDMNAKNITNVDTLKINNKGDVPVDSSAYGSIQFNNTGMYIVFYP